MNESLSTKFIVILLIFIEESVRLTDSIIILGLYN